MIPQENQSQNDGVKSVQEILGKKKRSNSQRENRAVNGGPVNLYVEYAIVIDSTTYDRFKQLNPTMNTNTLVKYIQIYYTEFVNSVILCLCLNFF